MKKDFNIYSISCKISAYQNIGGRSSPTVPRILSPKKPPAHITSGSQSLMISNQQTKDIATTSRNLFIEAVQKTEGVTASPTSRNVSASVTKDAEKDVASNSPTSSSHKASLAMTTASSTSLGISSTSDNDSEKSKELVCYNM